MFGRHRSIGMSNMPWCVRPSAPTHPARSTANTTGNFRMHTSCMIWSNARWRNVE